MSARRADLTEGTRIEATTTYPGRAPWVRTGTVEYQCKDYDGRSWRWMVMFTRDDGGGIDGAWLPEVRVL